MKGILTHVSNNFIDKTLHTLEYYLPTVQPYEITDAVAINTSNKLITTTI